MDWGVEGPPFETACGQIEGKPQSVLRIGGMKMGHLRLHPGQNIPRISTGSFQVRPFAREVLPEWQGSDLFGRSRVEPLSALNDHSNESCTSLKGITLEGERTDQPDRLKVRPPINVRRVEINAHCMGANNICW